MLLSAPTTLLQTNLIADMDAKKLKNQLIVHEGYRTQVYKDSYGNRTVGVGFNLERLDAVGCLQRVNADFKQVANGEAHLTADQVQKLLECGIAKVDAFARDVIKGYDELNDVRQRVICDMIFNLGPAGFLKFEKDLTDVPQTTTPSDQLGTMDLVEEGRFKEAAVRMLKTKWAHQVGRRAKVLSRMMATGEDTYDL